MQKAKSRLSSQPDSAPRAPHQKTAFAFNSHLRYLPTLLLSLPFYGVLYYLFHQISPTQIQHILFPNSYMPLHVVFFLANGFLFSFLFINTRRGFLLSAVTTILLFLKLQLFIITWQFVALLLISFAIIELILTLLGRKRTHANIVKRSY
jgi:hypothetical protein